MKLILRKKSYSLSDISKTAPTPDNKAINIGKWDESIRSILKSSSNAEADVLSYFTKNSDNREFLNFIISKYGFYCLDYEEICKSAYKKLFDNIREGGIFK
jgi:hypothetical protein